MTENAFFPVFLFWVLAVVVALERPTVLRQLAAVGLSFVAYLTRNQGAVLVPALLTAIVVLVLLEAWADEGGFVAAALRRAAAFTVTWVTIVGGVAAYLVYEVGIKGKTVSDALLGGYSVLTDSSYSVEETLRWFLYHLGELDLAVGIIPFAAFIVLLAVGLRRAPPSREVRVFAVVALSATLWLGLEVGAFASTAFGRQIQERNLFYLEPLFLIALAVLAGRTLPRSPRANGAAALTAAALAGLAPYDSFLAPNAVANAFGLLPLWRAEQHGWVAPSHLQQGVILGALAAALVFLLLPRRAALLAPTLILAYLAAMNSPVEGRTSQASSESRYGGVQGPRDWIDRAVGTKPRVAAIWSGAPGLNFVTLWDNEFFNRSVGPVYNLYGPPDGLPQETVTIDPKSSAIRDPAGKVVRAEYVLTDSSLEVAGSPIASDPGLGMVLYRVGGPVRLIRRLDGVYPDSWSGPSVRYARYPCAGGTLSVELAGYARLQRHRVTVVARSDAKELARTVVPPGGHRSLTIPLTPMRGLCLATFAISPTVMPAKVLGTDDTRELGVLFKRITFRPGGR